MAAKTLTVPEGRVANDAREAMRNGSFFVIDFQSVRVLEVREVEIQDGGGAHAVITYEPKPLA